MTGEHSKLHAPELGAAQWWIEGPIFATRQRDERITTLAPAARPGRFTLGMLWPALGLAVFWAAFGFFAVVGTIVPDPVPWWGDLDRQWWWYAIIVAGGAVILTARTFGLYRRMIEQFGQHLLAAAAVALPITLGFFLALAAHCAMYAYEANLHPPGASPDPSEARIVMIFALVAAVAVIVLAVYVPLAAVLARQSQSEIARLRQEGDQDTGVIETVEFLHHRVENLYLFTVVVHVDTADGSIRIPARMATQPERVPLVGEAVVVFSARRHRWGEERTIHHIEVKDALRMRFDPDTAKFAVTGADGGGG